MSWRRQIQVIGGTVQAYDYPFLFPRKLITLLKKSKKFNYKIQLGLIAIVMLVALLGSIVGWLVSIFLKL